MKIEHVIFFLLFHQTLFSQIGGLGSYDFLNLTQSARTGALGGYAIATIDGDINLGFSNPALLNQKMRHKLAVNHNFHLADISYGSASFGIFNEKHSLTFLLGANYIDYGEFVRTNQVGRKLGTFKGKETAFTFGASKEFQERLHLGVNLKFVNSTFDSYTSSGLGMDIGITYEKKERNTVYSFVVKNLGYELSSFDSKKESFPLDIQLGLSKKLNHLPFQFMITAFHLNKWNLRSGVEIEQDPIFIDQQNRERSSFSIGVENFFRHFAFGGELSIGKNEIFQLRLGYNHQRKKDLSVSGFRSFSGISYGFGIKIKKIRLDYAVAKYHLAGGVNHLSLLINLHDLLNKI